MASARHAKAAFFVPGRGAQKDLRHENGQFFEHIRIASVARIEGEWIGFEPDVSKSGGLGTLVSAYQKGQHHELLCVSRSAWGDSPPRSILYCFERWISDRNVQHLRRGYVDDRRRSTKRTNHVKQAILATVISVKKRSSDSVAVRLESDELNDATVIHSTGLDCERTRIKRPGCRLDVTCKGDPRAEVGDTVPVIVESEPGN